ncbi:uncharacterized protein LOC143793938 isoform X1 [Ranitomeya variabilis]|uniref:uncharacterized protein LOC143793938 isoform X1 n=1 Tax=Ranitomeya variabilis TaxID=490064 RepID=UPI004055BAF5
MSTFWLYLCVTMQVSWNLPVYSLKTLGHLPVQNKIGIAGETNNFIKQQRPERMDYALEILDNDRWSKGQDILRHHRSQCNYINQSWTQWQGSTDSKDPDSVYMLKVFTGPLKPIFLQKNLLQYMSRIYRCCKLGFRCRKVKGLQGTLDKGGNEAAFYIDLDIFSLSVHRAELHFELSAEEQVTVIPVLNMNGLRHSSFTQIRRGHIIDLTLDVMFILQALKEKEMVETMTEDVTELSLSLHCIQNDLHVPCNRHGVTMLHHPFIALQYQY